MLKAVKFGSYHGIPLTLLPDPDPAFRSAHLYTVFSHPLPGAGIATGEAVDGRMIDVECTM